MTDIKIDQKRFQRAMKHAPQALTTELRKGLKAHHQRFVNRMKKERLAGRPGLKTVTGTLKRGLRVLDKGSSLDTLRVASVFTGAHAYFAHVHEGLTFSYMRGGKPVHVTMPPRLEFRKTWDDMLPGLEVEIDKATGRALAGVRT